MIFSRKLREFWFSRNMMLTKRVKRLEIVNRKSKKHVCDLQKRIVFLEGIIREARLTCGQNTMNCPGSKAVKQAFEKVFPNEIIAKKGSR